MEEGRTRAYRRHQRRRVIKRKRHILNMRYGKKASHEIIPHDGILHKGKIHCSCKVCSQTVRTDGWKPRDKKQLMKVYDLYEEDFDWSNIPTDRNIRII